MCRRWSDTAWGGPRALGKRGRQRRLPRRGGGAVAEAWRSAPLRLRPPPALAGRVGSAHCTPVPLRVVMGVASPPSWPLRGATQRRDDCVLFPGLRAEQHLLEAYSSGEALLRPPALLLARPEAGAQSPLPPTPTLGAGLGPSGSELLEDKPRLVLRWGPCTWKGLHPVSGDTDYALSLLPRTGRDRPKVPASGLVSEPCSSRGRLAPRLRRQTESGGCLPFLGGRRPRARGLRWLNLEGAFGGSGRLAVPSPWTAWLWPGLRCPREEGGGRGPDQRGGS